MPDMLRGYYAGRDSESDDLPQCHQSESPAFKHGWLNGRDDRIGKPRERADVLRRRADMIDGGAHGMTRILPFRKPSARTPPKPEPARVGVNVTAAARESAREMFNEARIRILGNAWLIASTAGDDRAERQFWDAYVAAKAKRSPAQVARIETARGLR